MIFSQVMAIPKNQCFEDLLYFGTIILILKNFYFLEMAITWLKIIQILQVGGVLESSGPPLDDGHRDF